MTLKLQTNADGKLRLKSGKLVVDDGTHGCCCGSGTTPPACSCFCSSTAHPTNAYQVTVAGVSFQAPAGLGIACGDPLAVNFGFSAPSFGTPGFIGTGSSSPPTVTTPGCCCAGPNWRRFSMLKTCSVGATYVNDTTAGGFALLYAFADIYDVSNSGLLTGFSEAEHAGANIPIISISNTPSSCTSAVTIASDITVADASHWWFGGSVTFTPQALGSMGDCTKGDVKYDGPCTSPFSGICTDYAP